MGDGILQRVRIEGFRAGFRQGAQVGRDEAFLEGFVQGEFLGRDRCARWGWFCFLCGIAVSVLIYAFGKDYLP